MRDGRSSLAILTAIAAATYAADGAPITIDRLNYQSVTFALSIGAGGITFNGTNKVEVKLEHSDDGTTWEPVGADNVLGAVPDANGVVVAVKTAHADPTTQVIGYVDGTIADRRYVRLWPDFSGTHGTGTPISAVAILGQGRQVPVA